MSLASRAGDLYFTFRFVNLLTTDWVDTDAYKLGIIDKNGKRDRTVKIKTSEQKTHYTTFHRLVFSIKRLINKAPGGSSQIATYATALYMIKEEFNLSDDALHKIADKVGISMEDLLAEKNEWFLLDNKNIAQGMYRIRNEKVIPELHDDLVKPNDKIRVVEKKTKPVGDVYGLDIYEGIHVPTNKKVYFTLGEIYK